jgi:hypothetical protein
MAQLRPMTPALKRGQYDIERVGANVPYNDNFRHFKQAGGLFCVGCCHE